MGMEGRVIEVVDPKLMGRFVSEKSKKKGGQRIKRQFSSNFLFSSF
jgi:hypothetical protein